MPFNVGSIFGTNTPVRGTTGMTNAQRAVACSCPACTGLVCLDRPRFFAGQLLSEAELNSEMDYILAKQRLHNRYLHGVGTVCGLEVVCSNCDGQVVVKPGYAIDPCGNDIVVCQEQQFDVMKAIQACCDAVRKKNKTICDPYQPFNPGCTGQEEHWCITVAYNETPTQPVTPLRGKTKTCSCTGSCGCVSNCGCAGSNGSTQSNGCASTPSAPTTTTSTACEPTRILEGFTLGVVPDPENCATSETLFQNTLLSNLFKCLSPLINLKNVLSPTALEVVALSVGGGLPGSAISNSDAYLACCQFRQYVVDLFTNSDFAIKCTALNVFDAVQCPAPPASNERRRLGSDPAYLGQIQDSIVKTLIMLAEFVRDCVCDTIMPSCPTDPGDDRLILACLTIKDGKITDICNFGCRQFAGSFPSFFYWLSLIPIVPLLKLLFDDICCSPAFLSVNSPLVNNMQKLDPGGTLLKTFTDGGFALPQMVMDRAMDIMQKFSLQGIINSIPANGLNVATLRGMPVEKAQESLKQYNVSFEERQVNSRAEIPIVPDTPVALGNLVSPFAKAGDHVVLFETKGQVVEVQRAGTTSSAAVADLRRQVESLQADMAKLKKAQGKQK